jgi:hypothetical protein
MGSLRGFSALESECYGIIELLSETTEKWNESVLEEMFEEGERKCKEALDDHYVSLRLAK